MNKKLQERKNRLLPGGIPRYIRCYDNGGETIDRYTVVFTGNYRSSVEGKETFYVGMSGSPFHPQGVCQHGSHKTPIDQPRYSHLGKKITFRTLPEDCQKVVVSDYKDLWDLTEVGIDKQGVLDIIDKE